MTYKTHQATAIAIFSGLTVLSISLETKLFNSYGNPLTLWLTMYSDFKEFSINFLAYLPITDSTLLFYMLLLVSIGALLPDLDHEKSYISRKLRITGLSWLVSKLTHRGPTHRIDYNFYFFGGFSLLCFYLLKGEFYLFYVIPLLLGIGSVLHIFGDMHTKSGVRLFGGKSYGLFPKKFRFSTGKKMENIWFLFYSLISFYFIALLTNVI
jgi:inner membrane protein